MLYCELWVNCRAIAGVLIQTVSADEEMKGRRERRSVCVGERWCVSEREQPLTTMTCICNAPNKSSPSNLREIHFMGCSFLVCSGYDIVISFAGPGCSIRLLTLRFSERRRNRNSCASQTHTSVFCEQQWQSPSYITYLFSWTQLHRVGTVPCLSTNLRFLSNESSALKLRLQVWDKTILSSSVKSWGDLQNRWRHPPFSEKSRQPHHGVQDRCGGTQKHARCGCNLD